MIVDLNSKTAIITGAAGGIGKAVTDAVFDAGARVFAVDQSEKIRENEHRGEGTYFSHIADVSRASSVDTLIDKCLKGIGPPDILINIAAISAPCLVHDMTLENWQHNYELIFSEASNEVRPGKIYKWKSYILKMSQSEKKLQLEIIN